MACKSDKALVSYNCSNSRRLDHEYVSGQPQLYFPNSLLGNVDTRMRFQPLSQSPPVLGWGVRPFNSSLGNNMSVISDRVVQGLFLKDTAQAIDITPSPLLAIQ